MACANPLVGGASGKPPGEFGLSIDDDPSPAPSPRSARQVTVRRALGSMPSGTRGWGGEGEAEADAPPPATMGSMPPSPRSKRPGRTAVLARRIRPGQPIQLESTGESAVLGEAGALGSLPQSVALSTVTGELGRTLGASIGLRGTRPFDTARSLDATTPRHHVLGEIEDLYLATLHGRGGAEHAAEGEGEGDDIASELPPHIPFGRNCGLSLRLPDGADAPAPAAPHATFAPGPAGGGDLRSVHVAAALLGLGGEDEEAGGRRASLALRSPSKRMRAMERNWEKWEDRWDDMQEALS